jgi:hypothetical protein
MSFGIVPWLILTRNGSTISSVDSIHTARCLTICPASLLHPVRCPGISAHHSRFLLLCKRSTNAQKVKNENDLDTRLREVCKHVRVEGSVLWRLDVDEKGNRKSNVEFAELLCGGVWNSYILTVGEM